MLTVQEKREAEQILVARVKAGRTEPSMQALCKLLEGRLKKLDTQIRVCSASDFVALQAQAQQLDKLIEELTQP